MSDMNPLTQTVSMTQTVSLLKEAGLLGALSPIEESGVALSETDRKALVANGLVDGKGVPVQQWQNALTILQNPDAEVRAVVASSSGVRVLIGYLCPDVSEHMVGFTPAPEEQFNLVWPVRDDHLLAMIVSGLGLDDKIQEHGVSELLSRNALMAMAAYADAVRGIELENMLARVTNKVAGASLDQVLISANEGLLNDDRRWVSALLRDVVPDLLDPKEEGVLKGLTELAATGWIHEERTDYWVMTEAGRAVLTHWQMPMTSAVLGIRTVAEGGVEETKRLGMIRTIASIWTVQLDEDEAKGLKLRIAAPSSSALLGMLEDRLAGVASVTEKLDEPDQSREDAPKFCLECGSSLGSDDAFCSGCGKKLG